jgi:hypothetical protein
VPKASRTRAHSLAEMIRTVHQRGTRGARLGSIASSPFVTLKHKDQPPPSHETRSAEGVQDPGPQSCRDDQDRPSRGTRGARLGYVATSPFVALKHKEQPPPIHETRNAESAFGDRHRVTARGHLGAIERIAQRAEAPGLAAEGITAFSRDQFSSTSILVLAKNE